MKIPFISGEGPDGHLPVNLYFSPRKIYGRDALVGRPGLLEFSDLGYSCEVRAGCTQGEFAFFVCGDRLYRVDKYGGSEHIGTLGNATGHAWIESNGTQVGIVENNRFYIYEDDALTEIKNDDMSFSPGSLAYEGGYFLAHDINTENFYESTIKDGTDWNEVDYALTYVDPDGLSGVYSVNGQVYAMGQTSGEVYYNSGGTTFGFSKIPGGNIPCGIIAEKSAADFIGTLMLLNENRTVVQASSTPTKLSNEHVDRVMDSMETVSDAVGFVFSMSGHTFYVLTFPYGKKTYVLDLTTKHWYEWRTGTGRWRPNCYVKHGNKHLVGDYTNGKIYELSQTTYTDDGDEITRQRAMPVPKMNGLETFSSFELEMESGTGISTGQGSDPMAIFDFSADKGKTWSDEIWCSIGKAGEWKYRPIWYKMGRYRAFTPRITITDPVKVVITGAYINGDS